MTRDKQRLVEEKEYKAKMIEERKQNLLNRPNPYQKDLQKVYQPNTHFYC